MCKQLSQFRTKGVMCLDHMTIVRESNRLILTPLYMDRATFCLRSSPPPNPPKEGQFPGDKSHVTVGITRTNGPLPQHL